MKSADFKKRSLLVEGPTDQEIVGAIAHRLGIKNAKCESFNGNDKLLRDLTAHIKESDAASIGIIMDANKSLERRWEAIYYKLSRSDLEIEIPKRPVRDGVTLRYGSQCIGVWVMPDNERTGELEDFVKEMIPESNVWDLARDYVERVKNEDIQLKKLSKSEVYAWLAVVDPGVSMGTAFLAGEFKFDTTSYRRFENWIRTLCE